MEASVASDAAGAPCGAAADELLDLGDALCELDAQFRVVRVNRRQEALTGQPAATTVGRSHWEVWPETAQPDSPYWREYHRCMRERVPVQFEDHFAPLRMWVSVRAYPVASTGGIAIFFRDDTARLSAGAEARRAHERLQAAQQRLVETLRLSGAGTWEWDLATDAWTWSPESYALFGVDAREAADRALFERIVEPEDLRRIFADLQRILAGATDDYRREFRAHHPTRGELWILGVGRIDRRARRVRGLNLDVTDRKQAELQLQEHRDRLALALAAGRVGIWEWDLASDRVRWTPETHEIMGRPEGSFGATHQAFLALVHPEDQPELRARIQAALDGGAPYEHRFRVLLPDDGARWVAHTGRVIRDAAGRPVTFIGTVRDVTTERAAEAALREADRRKTEFLAVLSHELRNPLAPIRNSLLLLERAAPDSDAQRRARQVLQRQVDQLGRLVDDLLDVSRITHGKIELALAAVDARDLVRRACADVAEQFEQRGVQLLLADAPEPLWVEADAARLTQMVGNLLHNALKFTPAGGRVEVRLARREGGCEVRVKDSGCGLDPAELEAIFEPFVQAERSRRGQGGLGLGLALVRELAVRHGGSVRAESAGLGAGAEFVLRLPLAPGPPPAALAATRAWRGRTVSVLVVDDNEDAATSLADLLELAGNRVRTAASGREALETLAADPPDVLICDIGLPDLTGLEVMRAMRARGGPRPALAVALTGYAQAQDRAAALAAGFDAHLAKPPALDELRRLMEAAAGRLPPG